MFLSRWYEFHRGYRLVKKEDGSEERIAVLGEEFRQVSPGFLPRTLEELRAGRERSAMDGIQEEQQFEVQSQAETGPSLEDTLDSLFLAASAEEGQSSQQTSQNQHVSVPAERTMNPSHRELEDRHSNVHAQAMTAASSRNREYQARRVAALRRELGRMRNGIERVLSGLRELGEEVPHPIEATQRLADLGRTLDSIDGMPSREGAERAVNSVGTLTPNAATSTSDRALVNMQARVDSARQHADEARRARDQAAGELDLADQEFRTSQQRLQQLQREQRTAENYTRLFGTREEMAAQGESYESPIGAMFSRAYDRFRVAEQVRRDERTLRQVLEDEAHSSGDHARQLPGLESRERDVWGVPSPLIQPVAAPHQTRTHNIVAPNREEAALQDYYALVRQQDWPAQSPGVPSDEIDVADVNQGSDDIHEHATEDNLVSLRYVSVTDDRLRALLLHNGELADPDNALLEDMRRIIGAWPESERNSPHWRALVILASNESLRQSTGWTVEDLRGVMAGFMTVASDEHQMMLDEALQHEDLVWAAGIPAARLASYRFTEPMFEVPGTALTNSLGHPTDICYQDSIEWMAEAYQVSSELRRRSSLTPPARLSMLYRLQAGERRRVDRDILVGMLQDNEAMALARTIHRGQISAQTVQQITANDQARQIRAREGDHSRVELDAQRQAAQAFAVAAGRRAMQTDPNILVRQLARRPSGLTAGFLTTAHRGTLIGDSSWQEDEEDDAEDRGLDAPDSGRPSAKPDEDMTVRMDCRICYSQLAEIACLPCGHLVMCRWCSDQHSPTMQHDRTRPRRAAGCPVCRKGIRQKVRVFRP